MITNGGAEFRGGGASGKDPDIACILIAVINRPCWKLCTRIINRLEWATKTQWVFSKRQKIDIFQLNGLILFV